MDAQNILDAVANGYFIALTSKMLFGGGGLKSIMSRETLNQGAKLAVAQGVYNMIGRPIVKTTVGTIVPSFSGN